MNHSYSSPVCNLWQLEMSLISVLKPVLVLCYSHYKSAVGLIMSHWIRLNTLTVNMTILLYATFLCPLKRLCLSLVETYHLI